MKIFQINITHSYFWAKPHKILIIKEIPVMTNKNIIDDILKVLETKCPFFYLYFFDIFCTLAKRFIFRWLV